METFQYTITDEVGLHARPAGLLVKQAKQMGSVITLQAKGKSADAKKIIAVMALGVKRGETVTVSLEGPQEQEEKEELSRFFAENL
ncbi:MAG TPA: HPr family phosphocarrier protein [Candidatus Fournierella pullicola]|uniref:HPr family phosphocarrier protein n=1 Tax=Candidatus Allofournierella pullicola TaxID=2838596 RepID=A0A9D1V4U4_9FIRM|nr:HPr family phosphocarrier protein [Candidatus Fournierella pullicola]